MSTPQTCQAIGCGRIARHWWRVGDRYGFLCSECKLAVQHPWENDPELEPEGVQPRGNDSGDGEPAGTGVRPVPALPEVDADEGD